MNTLVNQSKTSALPSLSYGYVRKGDTTKWIFWENDSFTDSQRLTFEINSRENYLKLVDCIDKYRIPLKNSPAFCEALGVDWLTKSMPNPQLFLEKTILEQVALLRITNPASLASFILGNELSAKVAPKLFFRHVLTNLYFDSWDKIKIAILLLMVTENEQNTLENITVLTNRFNYSYPFFRIVNLSFKMGVRLNCFLSDDKVIKNISLLDKEDKFNFRKSCYVKVDGTFESCIELVRQYSTFAEKAVSLSEFEEMQKKSIYFGTLSLPKGMNLIKTPEDLVKEGRRMSHCVGGYVDKMLAKKSFFLHVKLETSATVEIVKNSKQRRFQIKEIRGVSNKAVPTSVINKVISAISTINAQSFFFMNSPKGRKRKVIVHNGPTLFDDFFEKTGN